MGKLIGNVKEAFNKGFNLLFGRKPTLSFCITCRDRMWQITQTLPQNLRDNYRQRDKIEFILVDFASGDGLQEWVRDNFREELESGYLKYYFSGEMPRWHMGVAKNTSHRLANNEVVVNLDCDNFTGPDGGEYVRRQMKKYGWKTTVMHVVRGEKSDGTAGRIITSRENFLKVGGYDEDFAPWGFEDIDLKERLRRMGLTYRCKQNEKYARCIYNESGLGVYDEPGGDAFKSDSQRNRERLMNKRETGAIYANEGREIGVQAVRMFHK